MMRYVYKIAGTAFSVRCVYPDMLECLSAYACTDDPAFEVSTDTADIHAQRDRALEKDIMSGQPLKKYNDRFLERQAFYEKLAEGLCGHGALLMNAAALSIGGCGYIQAPEDSISDEGEATQLRELFGAGAGVLSEQLPILLADDEGAWVCSTPFGKGGSEAPIGKKLPLKAVCIASIGFKGGIALAGQSEAEQLLQKLCVCGDTKLTGGIISAIVKNVQVYKVNICYDPASEKKVYDTLF